MKKVKNFTEEKKVVCECTCKCCQDDNCCVSNEKKCECSDCKCTCS